MNTQSQLHRWSPLFALGLTLALTTAAHADTSARLQINFGRSPHWSRVEGTRVQEIREGERPDYDMFRYGGSYYVYNQDRWYVSHRAHGEFRGIDDHAVPDELSRVPRDHWRNYPTTWLDRDGQRRSHRDGRRAQPDDRRRY